MQQLEDEINNIESLTNSNDSRNYETTTSEENIYNVEDDETDDEFARIFVRSCIRYRKSIHA